MARARYKRQKFRNLRVGAMSGATLTLLNIGTAFCPLCGKVHCLGAFASAAVLGLASTLVYLRLSKQKRSPIGGLKIKKTRISINKFANERKYD